MSEAPTTPNLVELVRRAYEAASRRDLDTVMSFIAPDAIWDLAPVGLGMFEGRAAIRGFYEDWIAAYDEIEWQPKEVRELGNGVTFNVIVAKGRPVGSSGEIRVTFAGVDTWVDGVIVRVTSYTDAEEARAAAERLAASRG